MVSGGCRRLQRAHVGLAAWRWEPLEPDGWQAAAGRLCFGSLDAAPKLRWASTLVADTPEALAMDPLTSTCAVLTRSLAGEQQLRVVEAATLSVPAAGTPVSRPRALRITLL